MGQYRHEPRSLCDTEHLTPHAGQAEDGRFIIYEYTVYVKTLFTFFIFVTFYVFNVFFILLTFFYFVFIFLSNTCRPARHRNSRLCIGLQLQAQKLLMITVKFR